MGGSESRPQNYSVGKGNRLIRTKRSSSEHGLDERTADHGQSTSVKNTYTSTVSLHSSSHITENAETRRSSSNQNTENVTFIREQPYVAMDQKYTPTPIQYRFGDVIPRNPDTSTTCDVVTRNFNNGDDYAAAHPSDQFYEPCEEQIGEHPPENIIGGDVSSEAEDIILQNLNKVRPQLIEQLDGATIARVVDELMTLDDGRGLISGEMWDRVQAQNTEEQKARMLIDILRQQGTRAIKAFVVVLKLPRIGKSQLAQLLDPSVTATTQQATGEDHGESVKESHSLDSASHSDSYTVADARVIAIKELEKMQLEFGTFSYYSWNQSLVIHPKDDKANGNREALANAVNNIVQRYLNKNERSYSVTVSNKPLVANLCCPKIGSILRVESRDQTTGMYVVNHGVIHWVSVAHNYVRAPHEAIQGIPVENLSTGQTPRQVLIDFGDDVLVSNNNSMVRSPLPYSCLRHRPRDHMGREMFHTVDIMIGPVPMVAPVNINDHRERFLPLMEVRDRARLIYRISRILCPVPLGGAAPQNYVIYDITADDNFSKYKNVMAVLPGGDVAEGTIVSNFGAIDVDGVVYYNAVLIAAANDTVPASGDSGSIWVAKDSSEAVAITVGMVKECEFAENVWIAVLLFPSLLALCEEHSRTFGSVNDFFSVDGHALLAT